jgi:hypothetical protein
VFGEWLHSVIVFGLFDPHILGAHSFFIFDMFSMIFSVLHVPRGELQFLLGHHKQRSLPLSFAKP